VCVLLPFAAVGKASLLFKHLGCLQPDSSAPHKSADDVIIRQLKALVAEMDRLAGQFLHLVSHDSLAPIVKIALGIRRWVNVFCFCCV
jgi:hypothetical protein